MASTAGSSTGATEHELALASTNIGLPGKAINGPLFEKNHAKDLQQIFTALLGGNTKCVGLLICEAGNVDNLCTDEGMKAIDACIIQAFQAAGAAEHVKFQGRSQVGCKYGLLREAALAADFSSIGGQ